MISRAFSLIITIIMVALPLQLTWSKESIILTGYELSSNSSYGYLGSITPLVIGKQKMFLRLWIDQNNYQYDKELTVIDGSINQVSIALGWTPSNTDYPVTIYLGELYSKTELVPADPDNINQGSAKSGFFSIDSAIARTQCSDRIHLGASYVYKQKAYWLRARPVCWSIGTFRSGFEFVHHGDPNYQTTQLGVVLSIPNNDFADNLLLKSGVVRSLDGGDGLYLGVELTFW